MKKALQDLHDELISKGCNLFFIDGVGGPIDSDVERLGFFEPNWEVYYSERGQKTHIEFKTIDFDEAIAYYRKHVLSIQHWHLVAFTRSQQVFDRYKTELESHGIKTTQNDIPDYGERNDRVLRLFVVNQNIVEAKKLFAELPYFDDDLRHFELYQARQWSTEALKDQKWLKKQLGEA